MARPDETRVALIGAGFIAEIHLAVLRRLPGVRVVAVVDPDRRRAERLAGRVRARAHDGVAAMLRDGGVDVAHVLAPPTMHAELVRELLQGGVDVFCEKPLALDGATARELGALAAKRGRRLGVNLNLVQHRGVRRLRTLLGRQALGRLEHLEIVHHVPLRQLSAGQFGHFMFATERNILFEQAVHPISVALAHIGPVRRVHATASPAQRLTHGGPFRDSWWIGLDGAHGTATIRLAFGRDLEERTVQAIATDGALRLDLVRGTAQRIEKTVWLDPFDVASNVVRGGLRLLGQGLRHAIGYGTALFRLTRSVDPFLDSMRASIEAFHRARQDDTAVPLDAEFAAAVLDVCAQAADQVGASGEPVVGEMPPPPGPARDGEVVLTGAGGFLGRALVPLLLDADRPVTVLVRRPDHLPPHLRDPRVRVFQGDARDAEAVKAAVQGAAFVVHMATCAGETPETTVSGMVDGAKVVGEACLRARVRRLVFVSSTAALYLGDPGTTTGAVGPDRKPKARAPYARGKILAERALAELAADKGLRHVVLRPAIVVGPGAPMQHSGLGLWVRDNRCVGWGTGQTELPFVLSRDVATAIVGALDAEGVSGRSYNLAGDLRWTPAEWIWALRRASGRALYFHPRPVWMNVGVEWLKWFVKLAALRPGALPSLRDFRSRTFTTVLDCSDAKRDLGWRPETDRAAFDRDAIAVHRAREVGGDAAPAGDAVRARRPTTVG